MNLGRAEVDTIIQGLKRLGKAELESYIESGTFIVAKDVFNLGQFEPVKLWLDWKIVSTSPGNGNYPVILYLVPIGKRARDVWAKGQINYALKHGLPEDIANKWALSRVKQKHVVIDLVRTAVTNLHVRELYMNYRDGMTFNERNAWAAQLGYPDNFSDTYRQYVGQLFRELFE